MTRGRDGPKVRLDVVAKRNIPAYAGNEGHAVKLTVNLLPNIMITQVSGFYVCKN